MLKLALLGWTVLLLLIYYVQCHRFSRFPSTFQFGSASSAYQTEGAWNVDGKGENVWDRVTHTFPDVVLGRHNADVTTDSYHKYKEDVQMLRHLGVDFYRFSISWSRVLPNGDTSIVNELGLQFYDNLINELLANGIEPVVTIYHWDLPTSIQELGGLNDPQFIGHFVQYAEVLFKRYHDRVKTWITFNEPHMFCKFSKFYPPFIILLNNHYMCSHNVLLAHAKVYNLYKQKFNKVGDRVGISNIAIFAFPKNKSNASDVAAADRFLQFSFGQFAHPIFSETGDYTQVMKQFVDANSKVEGRNISRLPDMTEEEKQLIKGKADFLGINYYTSRYTSSITNIPTNSAQRDDATIKSVDAAWPHGVGFLYSVPEGLRGLLNWIRTEYNNPEVIITENGWSDDGELADVNRIEYLQSHFNATLNAIHDGCNVTAHTTWSLMDNFEWASGYSENFGLYNVDFNVTDRPRTPKLSVEYLRNVFKNRLVQVD